MRLSFQWLVITWTFPQHNTFCTIAIRHQRTTVNRWLPIWSTLLDSVFRHIGLILVPQVYGNGSLGWIGQRRWKNWSTSHRTEWLPLQKYGHAGFTTNLPIPTNKSRHRWRDSRVHDRNFGLRALCWGFFFMEWGFAVRFTTFYRTIWSSWPKLYTKDMGTF